jgi:hypothetical protein
MSIRLGQKTKKFVRLGLKAGVAAGALGGAALGVKQSNNEFDKYKESEQQRQREENVAVFAGIAADSKKRIGAQPVSQSGEEILKRTRGGVFGAGLTPPAPPPPPTPRGLAGAAVGVAVGQASLGDEIRRVGGDFYRSSLSKEETDRKFRAEQAARAREQSTTAMGGVGSTEASTKDLLRIGGRKVRSAVPNPLKFVR